MAVTASVVVLGRPVVVGIRASALGAESTVQPSAIFEESGRVLFGADPTEELKISIEVWMVIAVTSVKSVGYDSDVFLSQRFSTSSCTKVSNSQNLPVADLARWNLHSNLAFLSVPVPFPSLLDSFVLYYSHSFNIEPVQLIQSRPVSQFSRMPYFPRCNIRSLPGFDCPPIARESQCFGCVSRDA